MSVQDSYATINTKVTLGDDKAEADLRGVLEEAPALVGTQEWGKSRHDIFQRVTRASHYKWARPVEGGSPVLWDGSRYDLQRIHGARLSRAEFVGHLIGRKSRLGASYATVALHYDEVLDEDVVHIDAHLTAEIQFGKGYRKDLAHRLRVARHKREVRRVERIVRLHEKKGRRVVVTMDGNFDGLRLRGLTSCWQGRASRGTLGSRAVDIVFAPDQADRVRVIANHSDHHAVVATYRRTA